MSMKKLTDTFARMYRNSTYRLWVWVLGIFTMIPLYFVFLSKKGKDEYTTVLAQVREELEKSDIQSTLLADAKKHVIKKNEYFKKEISAEEIEKQAKEIADKNFKSILKDKANEVAKMKEVKEVTMVSCFSDVMANPLMRILSFVVSFPLYILMILFANPISKYITDRLFMMIFVLFGVTFLVFTILHFSPMDPALNILGQTATPSQIEQWNKVYGLDQPYIVQLWNSFENLITFDLGNSYQGNEDIAIAISNKFPTTMVVAFWAVFVSVAIAIPSGIISAIKQYSSFDYIFMFIALIGLSIPNFWLGLILILNLSINNNILPATYQVGNSLSLIMPAIVLGTGMSASVARMTRSSMLEVKHSDYILTARAKGLSERKVVLKHILGNAMIPIITVVGMQFGGMLGGSSVTEKVFNINGLGSWIVDKQFIPDIPVVLAGVVYISIVISLVNLVVDILYAFIDPRIKSKMKNY